MKLLDELNARARFGMKPGLENMQAACSTLGHPESTLRGVIHIAGTNGKGAVCAMLDACLRAAGQRVGRYTSPHLVSVNERFFLDGAPVPLARLDAIALGLQMSSAACSPLTYFEYLTLVAFRLYSETHVDYAILETGLGGRLDATNVCSPKLSIITRIGLDHCAWLGDTVEQIAAEKAGIIKKDVPIILGENRPEVRAVVEARAKDIGAPFFYAPDLASPSDIPSDFSLAGTFNRENALTVIAALKILCTGDVRGLAQTVWPGRFQRVGNIIVDGAHNPPAAHALAQALRAEGVSEKSLTLICGFCGDKDVDEVLRILAPFVARAIAVRTNNPRTLAAEDLAARLNALGLPATPASSILDALHQSTDCASNSRRPTHKTPSTLIAGSLFLAGEALVALKALPATSFDGNERLK